MKKLSLKLVSLLFSLVLVFLLFPSCSGENTALYRVTLEESQYFTIDGEEIKYVEKGENCSFSLTFAKGYQYAGDNVNGEYAGGVFTVKNVRANRYVVIDVASSQEKFDVTIVYHANGGRVIDSDEDTYQTGFNRSCYLYPWSLGKEFFDVFEREGYLPLEFNTQADGGGESFPIGGKILKDGEKIDLYVLWQRESDVSFFRWEKQTVSGKESVALTQYIGEEETVGIPEEIEGLPVTTVKSGCFADDTLLKQVVFSHNLLTVQDGAFSGCSSLTTVYMCDSVEYIKDKAFEGCENLASLRMIAARSPVYSMDLLSTFVRRVEVLFHEGESGKQNLLFYGGSGIFNGLDGQTVDSGLQQKYNVLNLGQNANLSAPFLLEFYLPYVHKEDILVVVPEYNQFLYSDEWHMIEWVAVENFYNVFYHLDIRNYKNVFSSYYWMMNGEVQFTITPKLRSGTQNYLYENTSVNEYFTRSYSAEYKKFMEFESETLNFSYFYEHCALFERMFSAYREKGVTLYWDPAAVYEKAYTNDLAEFASYLSFIGEKFSIPVLSGQEERMYSRELIYDSVVHLTTEGAKVNSLRIVESLKKVLA